MTLSLEAVQSLARLGYTADAELQFWQGLWESQGESFFWGFLRKEEEAAEESHRWLPRLRLFASECRRLAPAPSVDSLSPADKEQHRILLAKMREFEASRDRKDVLAREPNWAAILSTTPVGLSAAQEVFGGSGAVILEEAEQERWFSDVFQSDGEEFCRYRRAWWTIQTGLKSEDEKSIRRRYSIPDGHTYWTVVSGVMYGSRAGHARHELWRWDGHRADYIEEYCFDTY